MSKPPMEWSAILIDAVSKPGVISEAYSRFWSYSPGNQLLALLQCQSRSIEPGPIHTFVGWQNLGRTVRKGEKALTLCMPVVRTLPPEATDQASQEREAKPRRIIHRFVYRPHWFVLSQTEGTPYIAPPLPAWDEDRALQSLSIQRVEFRHLDGNAQGYASGQSVAVSPIAFLPHRTLFHEMAHVVLGHTKEVGQLVDGEERTPRNIREVEAECVSLICSESLGLEGAPFSRGYIQHWLKGQTIPDRSVHRIFKTADQILRAGRPQDNASREGGV